MSHYSSSGPPPGWEGPPPGKGCEIFVGKVPRDCYEDELVPVSLVFVLFISEISLLILPFSFFLFRLDNVDKKCNKISVNVL